MKKYLSLLALLFILAGLAFPIPALADTQNRAIQGEGGETDGSYLGSSDNYTNLNSNDDDTSYLYNNTTWHLLYHCYDMQDFVSAYQPGSLSVTALTRGKANLGCNGYITMYCRIGGVDYMGGQQGYSVIYQDFTQGWASNPATGTAWTDATINSAEFGFYLTENTASWRVTYFRITVTYTPPTSPVVITSAASSITTTSATLNGNITDDGGDTITDYGFVWDTSSRADPGSTAPPATYSDNWTAGTGSYSEGVISHATGGVLSSGTTYYVRACAKNSVDWNYGDEIIFSTIGNPSITTLAATNVGATTATLNGLVTNDGGEACTVKFAYTDNNTVTSYADILASAMYIEVTAAGTYTTSQTPDYDISSCNVSTTYYFATKITNTASSQYGSVLTFLTESGVGIPSNLVALPASTSISISWSKGAGSPYTVVRYSDGGYPATYTDGALAYLGMNTSTTVSGLTAGTNYYISAWGLNAGVYSATPTTSMTMCTTLAYDSATTTSGATLEPPSSSSAWIQTPSAAKVENLPLVGELVENNATAYKIPENWLWYFLWVLATTALGIIVYNATGRYNLVAASSVDGVLYVVGAILGLTSLWAMAVIMIIVMGFGLWGLRY